MAGLRIGACKSFDDVAACGMQHQMRANGSTSVPAIAIASRAWAVLTVPAEATTAMSLRPAARSAEPYWSSEQWTEILDTGANIRQRVHAPLMHLLDLKYSFEWWPGVELNHRHADFQSGAKISIKS
jgi:hypothetical protein